MHDIPFCALNVFNFVSAWRHWSANSAIWRWDCAISSSPKNTHLWSESTHKRKEPVPACIHKWRSWSFFCRSWLSWTSRCSISSSNSNCCVVFRDFLCQCPICDQAEFSHTAESPINPSNQQYAMRVEVQECNFFIFFLSIYHSAILSYVFGNFLKNWLQQRPQLGERQPHLPQECEQALPVCHKFVSNQQWQIHVELLDRPG